MRIVTTTFWWKCQPESGCLLAASGICCSNPSQLCTKHSPTHKNTITMFHLYFSAENACMAGAGPESAWSRGWSSGRKTQLFWSQKFERFSLVVPWYHTWVHPQIDAQLPCPTCDLPSGAADPLSNLVGADPSCTFVPAMFSLIFWMRCWELVRIGARPPRCGGRFGALCKDSQAESQCRLGGTGRFPCPHPCKPGSQPNAAPFLLPVTLQYFFASCSWRDSG